MSLFCMWMLAGMVSTILVIYVFRRNTTTIPVRELYFAAIMPWLGPLVAWLLIADIIARSTGKSKS